MTQARPTRVLIAEDEIHIRNYVLEILREEPGLDVTCVGSGEAAIDALHEADWDVVITDQRMGIADGVHVLEAAAKLQPDAQRMMMTGFAELPLIADAKNVGAVHRFLAKPFSPNEFLHNVGLLVRNARVGSDEAASESA